MSDLDDFKATFFEECSELLVELEEQLATLEAGDRHPDRLHAVFRAIHSIKGGAGAFGLTGLVGFTHAFETLLDHLRNDRIPINGEVISLCMRATDIVADFVTAARAGETLPDRHGSKEKSLFDALSRSATEVALAPEPEDDFEVDFTPVPVELAPPSARAPAVSEDDRFELPPFAPETGVWGISFVPHPQLYARANDPLLLFRDLTSLGELIVAANVQNVPPLADFEPFGSYCGWTLTLHSETATEERIREVFEFVEGDCDLSVMALDVTWDSMAPAEPAAPAAQGEEFPGPSFLDLAASIAADAAKPAPAPAAPASGAAPLPPPGPAAVAATGPAARPAQTPRPPTAHPSGPDEADRRAIGVQTIRVDLDKIDRVVNMVGELVITQSMLTEQMDETLRQNYQELVRGLEVLAQTTRGLQDSVMAIRAQPVKSVFARMPRLARELAIQTGKKIRLEMSGEATEIDKTVIEQLSDPLTHMIRNAADHGIEGPARRLALGKPETGTIRLSAEQAGGNILIAVEDDGAGIDRDRVVQVARSRGVLAHDAVVTDEQIDQLIFAPGFSTAATASDISGRGVGLDVVISNIQKIGGSVHVRSWPGRGTRLTLRLPLTLAVLEVMLVKVAAIPYVIPLSSIVETIQCARATFSRVPSGGQVLQVRGEYVPVIDLCQCFGLEVPAAGVDRFVVLCEGEGGSRRALVVDDIIGQQQVVIKSLEENFERLDGVAGGTILGDGSVALILDVQGLKAGTPLKRAA